MQPDDFAPGTVWLVGAGPGDPELLTMKAVRLIERADIVFYDALVGDGVLALIPARTEMVSVGKRSGRHSKDQRTIDAMLVEAAAAGKRVVRLKGGDPCIFGRGSEEADWLRQYGIEVEMVNGITAGLAGATNCGIPLTLRGVSRGVTLVTAHTQDDSTLNWQALAQGGTTLVVYMGVAKLPEVRDSLLAGGMRADMPVAMIENASLPQQRECRSTLAGMQQAASDFALKSPAILVIGEVAAQQQTQALAEIA